MIRTDPSAKRFAGGFFRVKTVGKRKNFSFFAKTTGQKAKFMVK